MIMWVTHDGLITGVCGGSQHTTVPKKSAWGTAKNLSWRCVARTLCSQMASVARQVKRIRLMTAGMQYLRNSSTIHKVVCSKLRYPYGSVTGLWSACISAIQSLLSVPVGHCPNINVISLPAAGAGPARPVCDSGPPNKTHACCAGISVGHSPPWYSQPHCEQRYWQPSCGGAAVLRSSGSCSCILKCCQSG